MSAIVWKGLGEEKRRRHDPHVSRLTCSYVNRLLRVVRVVKLVQMLRQKRDGEVDARQPSAVGKKLNEKIVQNVIISVRGPMPSKVLVGFWRLVIRVSDFFVTCTV